MAARKPTAGKKPIRATGAIAKKTTVAAAPAMMQAATAVVPDEAPAEPAAAPKPEPKPPVATPQPKPVAASKPQPKPPMAKPTLPAAPARTNGSTPIGYPDLAALGRENLAAVARANAALVKGFEELGQEVGLYAQQNLASAVDTARALVGVRTITDLVALNRKLAQATLEGALANSARLSEIGIRVATEAFAPLNERVAQTFGRFGRRAG